MGHDRLVTVSGLRDVEDDQRHRLHRAVHQDTLIRLRPGVFTPIVPWNAAYPRERHLASAVAIAVRGTRPPIFCRGTALLFHGLPLDSVPGEVSLRALSSGASGYRHAGISSASRWPLMAERRLAFPSAWAVPTVGEPAHSQLALSRHHSLLVEDLRFCLADTLPLLPLDDAVIVADSILSGLRSTHAQGLSPSAAPWTRQELSDLSALCVSRKASQRFTWVAEFADARSASPGESLSRLRIHELGFVQPELQHRVVARNGKSLGILDFWWPGLRLAGEFDGWGKYTDASSYSGRDRDTVFREEKRRTERIQEEGIRFVRWMWEDLRNPRDLEEKLERVGVPRV